MTQRSFGSHWMWFGYIFFFKNASLFSHIHTPHFNLQPPTHKHTLLCPSHSEALTHKHTHTSSSDCVREGLFLNTWLCLSRLKLAAQRCVCPRDTPASSASRLEKRTHTRATKFGGTCQWRKALDQGKTNYLTTSTHVQRFPFQFQRAKFCRRLSTHGLDSAVTMGGEGRCQLEIGGANHVCVCAGTGTKGVPTPLKAQSFQ